MYQNGPNRATLPDQTRLCGPCIAVISGSKSYTILKLGVDTKSLCDTWSGTTTSNCDLDLSLYIVKV